MRPLVDRLIDILNDKNPTAGCLTFSKPDSINQLLNSLREDMNKVVEMSNATNTNATIKSATRSFLMFLEVTGQRELVDTHGVNDEVLSQFCIFVTRPPGGVKYRTLLNYISMGVRMYVLENQLPWTPVSERFTVKKVLRGIRRTIGDATTPVLAISIQLLEEILGVLNSNTQCGACIRASFTCAFFLLLRKGNMCAAKEGSTHERQPIKRKHLWWCPQSNRFWIKLVHTKTIQFDERAIWLPVPCFPGNPMICPTQALHDHLRLNNPAQDDNLFSYSNKPMSYTVLLTQFKTALKKCNVDYTKYAGHSFRRGGATWMFSELKMPSELIRVIGDWKSQAYMLYTTVTDKYKLEAVDAMQHAVAGHQWGVRIPASAGGQVEALELWNPSTPER